MKDSVGLVERAYAMRGPDREWLREVVANLSGTAPGTVGVAYAVDLSNLGSVRVGEHVSTDAKAFDSALAGPAHSLLSPAEMQRVYGRRVISGRSDLGARHRVFAELLRPRGFEDAFAIVALDARRVGVLLATLYDRPHRLTGKEAARSSGWRRTSRPRGG